MRSPHGPYTAAVHAALLEAGHVPTQVRTITEATGLRRFLLRIAGVRVLWEEEKGWSAATAGRVWWCPQPTVASPGQVTVWLSPILRGEQVPAGTERRQVPGIELEAQLAAYVGTERTAGPDPLNRI